MQPSVIALALFATVSAAAVEPGPVDAGATTPAPTSLSSQVAQQLAATLPGAAPAPAEARPAGLSSEATRAQPGSVSLAQAKEEAPNPEVLELPKMTVKQRPRPRLGEINVLGPKAFNEELARKNLSALDRSVLNKFTLPSWLGGVSAAERAREEYNIAQKQQFLSDVMTIARAAELADPANAKALREAATKP